MKKLFLVRTTVLTACLLQLCAFTFHAHGAAGDVDLSFDTGSSVTNPVSVVVMQPDGKVLIGGALTFINGTNHYASARLNADGSWDGTFVSNSFNPDIGFNIDPLDYSVAEAIAVQPDGQVLVGGYTVQYWCDPNEGGCTSVQIPFLDRLNPNGSREAGFSPTVEGISRTVTTLAVQPDGKVMVGGNFPSINGTNRRAVARLNADGSLDDSFLPDIAFLGVSSVALQPDGKMLLRGDSFTINATNFIASGIVRLNANGSFDNSFNPASAYEISTVALQPDGKVLLVGDFTAVNGTNRNRIARLKADGTLDSSFNPGLGTDGRIRSIALQSDGNILIGGDFTSVNGVVRPYVARLYGDAAAPALSIARSNTYVIVSWPATGLNFHLQETTNVTVPNSWSLVAQPVVTNGGQMSVSLPMAGGGNFYRLKSP